MPRERALEELHELAPAAMHCPNPSPFQSLHFGLHKAVKVKESYSMGEIHSIHIDNIERTWRNFRRTNDPRLGMACLGSELALLGLLGKHDVDFSCPRPRRFSRQLSRLTPRQMRIALRYLRFLNRAMRPSLVTKVLGTFAMLRFLAPKAIPSSLRKAVKRALQERD